MIKQIHYSLVAIAISFCLASLLYAQDKPAIGDKIEGLAFKDIRYLPRSLADFGEQQAYVFVFVNSTCPLVKRYMPRLNRLHQSYSKKGALFIAVNVGADDSIMEMASHALRFGSLMPFVKDFGGRNAKLLGVSVTPEVAILNKEQRLVYRGRIDDQYRLGGALPKAKIKSLENALSAILQGKSPNPTTTPVDGCQITFMPEKSDSTPSELEYYQDIEPIITKHCTSCHNQSQTAAPFSLIGYRKARRNAAMIAEVVREERMPPWYASPNHGSFQNDRRIPEAEKQLLLEWLASDMKKGEEPENTDSQLHKSETKWTIGKPDLVITELWDYTLPEDGFLPYRYVAFPHIFLEDTWIEAFEILPDNKEVVHHANLAYGAVGQKPGNSTFITGYVPGGQAMDFAPFKKDIAYKLPALSALGLQVHYVTTGKKERCKISIGIRFKRGVVKKQLHFKLADPRRFRIPAYHPAHPVHANVRLQKEVTLLGLFAHMHLRGKDMTFLAHYPNGETETLLEIPNFNFDWQLGYEIEAGTKILPKGTRVEAIAHYDNSAFNPYNPDPSKAVGYGEQSVDEMMNGYMFFTINNEELKLKIIDERGHAKPIPPKKKKTQKL